MRWTLGMAIGLAAFLPFSELTIRYQDIEALLIVSVFAAICVLLRSILRGRAIPTGTVALFVLTFIFLGAILPAYASIVERHLTQPEKFVHDNPIQIEAAVDFLRQGKNPYREDYTGTILAKWGDIAPGIPNPALWHVVALPGHLLTTLALSAPLHATLGFYDDRMLYIAAFVVALLVLYRLPLRPELRWGAIAAVGLNPLLVPFFIEGRNDIFVFSALLGAFTLLFRNRPVLASVVMGYAVTIKLFALLVLPAFLVVLVARSPGPILRRFRTALPGIGLAALVILLVVGPFLLWDTGAFLEDVVGYTSGTAPQSYPISGHGFSRLVETLQGVRSVTGYFPFWIFQGIAVIATCSAILPALYRRPSVGAALAVGGVTMFAGVYFSRFYHNNYLGLMFLIVIAGTALWHAELERDGRAVG